MVGTTNNKSKIIGGIMKVEFSKSFKLEHKNVKVKTANSYSSECCNDCIHFYEIETKKYFNSSGCKKGFWTGVSLAKDATKYRPHICKFNNGKVKCYSKS
jgi:hypothetical protein